MKAIPALRAFELLRDIPMLPRGSIFVYDEQNLSGLGSIAKGCLILAWEQGMCQGGWCGGTYILPGQCASDETWFAEVDNPKVTNHLGTKPKYYVTIEKHTFISTR